MSTNRLPTARVALCALLSLACAMTGFAAEPSKAAEAVKGGPPAVAAEKAAKKAAEKAAKEKAAAVKKAGELKGAADKALAEAKAGEADATARAAKKLAEAKAAGEKKVAALKAVQDAAAKKAADGVVELDAARKVAQDRQAAAEALVKNAKGESAAAASGLAAAKAAYDKAAAKAETAAKALKDAKAGNTKPEALAGLKGILDGARKAESDARKSLDAASDKAAAAEKALRKASSALEDASEETARCTDKVAKAKAGMEASAQKAKDELAKAEADVSHDLAKVKAAGDFAVADAAKAVKAAETRAADAAKSLEAAKATKGGPPAVAAADTKAAALPPARVTDVEAALAAAGVTFTGDTDWFASAKARDGRTLRQVFADALAITNAATAAEIAQKAARDNGYYICAVGREKDGTVKVEAGRFSQVDIRFGKENSPDGRWFTSAQIRERLERSLVRSGEPFNYNLLYSQFRDLNSNPDLSANIELRLAKDDPDGRALGVDVSVEEEWPFHAIFGIDNYGTDSVKDSPDEWMGRLTLQRLNLWKADHALTLNGYSSIDGTLYGGAGSYYVPFVLLDGRDAAVTIHGGYSEVDADEVVKYIDVVGTGWFAGVQASTELLSSLDYSLRLALGVTYRTTEDGLVLHEDGKKYKLEPSSVDIVPLSAALMFSNRQLDSLYGRTYLTLEGVYNLSDFGSDADEFRQQREAADPDYWLARLQIARIQTFGGSLTEEGYAGRSLLFAKAEAQYAGGALIPAEQMGVGGANSVRGYREREYLGDHAAVCTLEYRTPLLLGWFTKPPKNSPNAARDRLQFVVFTDAGLSYREDPLQGESDNEVLWGAGVGFRFAWSESFQLRCDYALPLEETVESEISDGGRFHVSAQCQF